MWSLAGNSGWQGTKILLISTKNTMQKLSLSLCLRDLSCKAFTFYQGLKQNAHSFSGAKPCVRIGRKLSAQSERQVVPYRQQGTCQWPECSLRKFWCKTESNLFRSSSELRVLWFHVGWVCDKPAFLMNGGQPQSWTRAGLAEFWLFELKPTRNSCWSLFWGCPGSTSLHILLFVHIYNPE